MNVCTTTQSNSNRAKKKSGKLSVNAYKNNLWFAFVIFSVSPVFLWLRSQYSLTECVCVCAVNLASFRCPYLHSTDICRIMTVRVDFRLLFTLVSDRTFLLHFVTRIHFHNYRRISWHMMRPLSSSSSSLFVVAASFFGQLAETHWSHTRKL